MTASTAGRAAEREALDHLERANGPLELRAILLALLLPAGDGAAEQAWQADTATLASAAAWRGHAQMLSAATRLPCFETLLLRMARQPLAARQALLEATRRLMLAARPTRPIDRLHWLLMRQRLGEAPAAVDRRAAHVEWSQLGAHDVHAIASFAAYLSRIVPVDDADGTGAAGAAWYAASMAPWRQHGDAPPRRMPDADGLVQALWQVQALPWMQRPGLLRLWVVGAVAASPAGRLGDAAADALRLAGTLIDTPLPPELARQYSPGLQEAGR